MPAICPCRRIHIPPVTRAETDVHHFPPSSWPLADGATRQTVRLCANGHRLAHSLLNEYLRHDGTPPSRVMRRFPPLVRELAVASWQRARHDRRLPVTEA